MSQAEIGSEYGRAIDDAKSGEAEPRKPDWAYFLIAFAATCTVAWTALLLWASLRLTLILFA